MRGKLLSGQSLIYAGSPRLFDLPFGRWWYWFRFRLLTPREFEPGLRQEVEARLLHLPFSSSFYIRRRTLQLCTVHAFLVGT